MIAEVEETVSITPRDFVHLIHISLSPDMHSIHLYTTSPDPIKNAFAPLAAERAIEVCSGLIDLARIENHVEPEVPRPLICFDEWNVWDPVRAPGWLGAEEKYGPSK